MNSEVAWRKRNKQRKSPMRSHNGLLSSVLVLGVSVSWSVLAQTAHNPPKTDAAMITNAMSAAPKSISGTATIVVMENDKMRTLRKGTGSYTCVPDDPSSPGNDPMCLDGNAMGWLTALMEHKEPPKGKAGLVYMLQGG